MIARTQFLDKLIGFKDKQLIKVVTGVRRCGKSTLLKMFQKYLLENGILQEQIIEINFEDVENEFLDDYKVLHEHIVKRLIPDKKNYIFLDEIQNVAKFQKAVDSLYIKDNVDLYITGSNSSMLSGELATLLSGRYIEVKMLPLSFKEYASTFNEKGDLPRIYRKYIENSSFPYVLELNDNGEFIRDYLRGILNTVVLKDIVARKKISDVSVLNSIIKFMFSNIGNISSIKKISDTMTSFGTKVSSPTVENYLSALVDSYILYKASRFDIKGKQYLKTGDKYYLVDIGLRYCLLSSKDADEGHILENVVYLELLRRGYDVYIGKSDSSEIDFVAVKNGVTQYYQVASTLRDDTVLARELKSLKSVNDHNQKFLLSFDEKPLTSFGGINQVNVFDWLLV